MENNNLESISDSILKSLIYDILNMKTIDFVTCVNKYARGTRYITVDNEVCKIKNDKVVIILDPEYFGIDSKQLRINVNYFKRIYARNILKDWHGMDNEEKDYALKLFASY